MNFNAKVKEDILNDKAEIDKLVKRFFDLFCVRNGEKANLQDIYNIFIHNGMIIKNVGTVLEICNIEQFIEPRQKMFDDGILIDFREEEIWERTDVFGNIAQRICVYEKSGISEGKHFEGRGMKTMQFIRTPIGWRMSSGAWDDEREGLSLADTGILQ